LWPKQWKFIDLLADGEGDVAAPSPRTSPPIRPWPQPMVLRLTYCPSGLSLRGVQPRLKSWGGRGLGPNTVASARGQRPGWVLGAGGGCPLPLWGPGGKFFWKSCILVTTCCEISCLLRTMGKKFRGPIHGMVGTPNLKVGGSVSPSPYGCCPYESAITCSYFRSLDKDGGHTIQSAIAKTLRCMQTSRLCVCYRMKSYIDNQSFTLRE